MFQKDDGTRGCQREGKEICQKWFGQKRTVSCQISAAPFGLLEILKDFESMSEGHFGCINVLDHRADLIQDKERPVLSAPYPAGPTARQFAAMEKN